MCPPLSSHGLRENIRLDNLRAFGLIFLSRLLLAVTAGHCNNIPLVVPAFSAPPPIHYNWAEAKPLYSLHICIGLVEFLFVSQERHGHDDIDLYDRAPDPSFSPSFVRSTNSPLTVIWCPYDFHFVFNQNPIKY